MTSLKDIRNRLKSVRSIQKVTAAMRIVAASKFRSSRVKADSIRIFHQNLFNMLEQFYENYLALDYIPFLFQGPSHKIIPFDPWVTYQEFITPHEQTALLCLITSDRGLCGGYNANIINKAKFWIKEHQNVGQNIKIVCIGRKGYEALKKEYSLYIVNHISLSEIQDNEEMKFQNLTDYIEDLFIQNGFDYADIAYTKFKNALVQIPSVEALLPLSRLKLEKSSSLIYEFELELERSTPIFVKDYLQTFFYTLYCESVTSENAARMTAMDNATRNADKMIQALTLKYNRSRQAYITNELTEIIAGAEAL